MLILIVGPQGSGKSTQGKLLAERLNLTFISMGELFRQVYAEGNPLGIEAHEFWMKGKLVPPHLTGRILQQYLHDHNDPEGYVIDSYPRNLAQYEHLPTYLPQGLDVVIEFCLSREQIMQRIEGRRRTERREDEEPHIIETRLKVFERETLPMVEQMKSDGLPIITISAESGIEEIHEDVMAKLLPVLKHERIA